MQIVSAAVAGLIFGLGVLIGGMGDPAKVQNFFDLFGTWDPSLAFVMVGAIAVTATGYRIVFRRPHPMFAKAFQLPTAKQIDLRLVLGSAVFGVGWGIAGFCPGGVVPVLGLGLVGPTLFAAGLIAGIIVARVLLARHGARAVSPPRAA
ncbi:MAG: DUF6691 family protein, partial [Hyphomicrobiaceae bacterium]